MERWGCAPAPGNRDPEGSVGTQPVNANAILLVSAPEAVSVYPECSILLAIPVDIEGGFHEYGDTTHLSELRGSKTEFSKRFLGVPQI
jgi:hypothetical protein